MDYLCETAVTEKKTDIINSMSPEKLTFYEFTIRTMRINEVSRIIYNVADDCC
jgi:hypothetical protein